VPLVAQPATLSRVWGTTTTPLPLPLYMVEAWEEKEDTQFPPWEKGESPFWEPLFLSLSLVLSHIRCSSKSCARMEYSTRYAGALPGFGSRRSSSATLARSEAESVVEHRMCAKLQCATLGALHVIREDFNTTLRSTRWFR
jgi:hypothetical protein